MQLNEIDCLPVTVPTLSRMKSVSTWTRSDRGPLVQTGTQGTLISSDISPPNQKNASVTKHLTFKPVAASAFFKPLMKLPGAAFKNNPIASSKLAEGTKPSGNPSTTSWCSTLWKLDGETLERRDVFALEVVKKEKRTCGEAGASLRTTSRRALAWLPKGKAKTATWWVWGFLP